MEVTIQSKETIHKQICTNCDSHLKLIPIDVKVDNNHMRFKCIVCGHMGFIQPDDVSGEFRKMVLMRIKKDE